jgi:dTDP-L-rhamnose 4-epimerase
MANLDGAKALVTGGAGLIGSHIVDLLLERGCRVRILDNLEPQTHPKGKPAWIPPEAEFVQGDMRSQADVERALEGVDVVFHQAAFGGFTAELSKYVDVNTTGSIRIFEAIQNGRYPIQKIVVASSQAIYGEGKYRCPAHGVQHPPLRDREQLMARQWEVRCPTCGQEMAPLPAGEDKPLDGATIYAITKETQERWPLIFGQAMDIPVVALRYAVTYGPRQSVYNPYTGVVSIFSTRMLNGLPPVVYEDGRQSRCFTYVGDVARANLFAMENDEANYQALNVSSGRATTVLDLVSALNDLYRLSIAPALRGEFRPGDVRHILPDSSRLNALGWKAETSLEEGLRRYVEWIETLGPVREYFGEAERLLKERRVVIESCRDK